MASLQAFHQVPKPLQASQTKLSIGHALALTLLIPAFRYFYFDYQKYLALGPGGTPATVTGYCRIKILSLFALPDPYQPPKIPIYMTQKEGRLSVLPRRQGPRPGTLGIAPHRQINQTSSPEIFALLVRALRTIAGENQHLEEGTSCFEKHGTGLFSSRPLRRTCGGEICHAHPSDGSLHLTLHPADAKVMLEAGLGERHPLARGGWLERFVPGGFVMVYAPRDEEELDVVLELVRAAAWWVDGKDITTPKTVRRDSGMDTDDLENSEAYLAAKRSRSIVEHQDLLEL